MRPCLAVALLVATPVIAPLLGATAQSPTAAADTAVRISVGGFVDGYFAYHFNRRVTLDRQFTTQPARHDEFNVNLAYLEMKADAGRMRGGVASLSLTL